MKKALILLAFLALTPAAHAELTKPIRYTWVVTSCETWNAAASALVLANGNPNVLVMPTGDSTRPWVILKLVEEGAVYDPEDEPYSCEVSATVAAASGRYAIVDSCHNPMLLSMPDGRAVVVSLKSCGEGKARAIRH
jgi:hypothetical protein